MTHIVHAFRRTAVPLVFYYTVTLVLPVVNGAASAGAVFLEHALIVFVVPLAVVMLACAIHALGRLLPAGSQVDTRTETRG